ncbi:MAG: hypothetical protein ABFD08_00935 [Syntrophomonas sp.]
MKLPLSENNEKLNQEIKMAEDKDLPPIISIEAENGTIWSPRYHKNTQGEWELNDKSFQKMIDRHMVLEKPTPKKDKD